MLLAAVLGASAATVLIAQTNTQADKKKQNDAAAKVATVLAKNKQISFSTGPYGEESEITELAGKSGSGPVAVTKDRDLYGADCVWIHLRNGAQYRSYDLQKFEHASFLR